MYKIGVIGTSDIVTKSVDAFLETQRAELIGVYSRTTETGEQFAQSYGKVKVYTQLQEMVQREDIDIVYIASPNTFHFEQAKVAIQARKHVVVEKPAVVTSEQWRILNQLAQENNVMLFEAIRHVYEPNFRKVTDFLATQQIDGATLQFGQYSSRMNDLHKGIVQNIFKPEMSAGVLMDLGVYVLHSAYHWFGIPNSGHYFPIKWTNGIDIQGHIVLQYDTFNVSAHISKRSKSIANSEIYLQAETLEIDSVDHIKLVRLHQATQENVVVQHYPEKRMKSQWEIFFDCLDKKEEAIAYYQQVHDISGKVIQMMADFRHANGIQFPADK